MLHVFHGEGEEPNPTNCFSITLEAQRHLTCTPNNASLEPPNSLSYAFSAIFNISGRSAIGTLSLGDAQVSLRKAKRTGLVPCTPNFPTTAPPPRDSCARIRAACTSIAQARSSLRVGCKITVPSRFFALPGVFSIVAALKVLKLYKADLFWGKQD